VALTWVSLAAMFILSDVIYLKGFPHWQARTFSDHFQ
jgi:hypothetical protein